MVQKNPFPVVTLTVFYSFVLRGAIVKGAYFNNTDLSNAYLDYANLTACDFTNSTFLNASLDKTDLSYTNLKCCDLRNIDFTSFNSEGVCLTNADLRDSKRSTRLHYMKRRNKNR